MDASVSALSEGIWMGTMNSRSAANPFRITKSNDLTDDQIHALWVNFSQPGKVDVLQTPESPMPTVILGGKGSGKTHLMRYHSFGVQRLRFSSAGSEILEGLAADRYLGIYIRCSGLNAEKFGGKGIDEPVWAELFAYYMELWLAQDLLAVMCEIATAGEIDREREEAICREIGLLVHGDALSGCESMGELQARIREMQKSVDYEVNNAILRKAVSVEILATRGTFIFGIPDILQKHIEELKSVIFVYALDEFENFSALQQKYVNTLIRERQFPVTFRVGARRYGIRTYETLSAGEEIHQEAEFEFLKLDERLRGNPNAYQVFARSLIIRRLEAIPGVPVHHRGGVDSREPWLDAQFEIVDSRWNSPYIRTLAAGTIPDERPWLTQLRKQLELGRRNNLAGGLTGSGSLEAVVSKLQCIDSPLLEKVNLLLFYQFWFRRKRLDESAKKINDLCGVFIRTEEKGTYSDTLDHYKSDLLAQIIRESSRKTHYAGIDTFIRMSEGLPRALITILKHVFDWGAFNGEAPFLAGKISLQTQRRGVLEASEWFLKHMRKAGEDGVKLRACIDRLGELFRVNRFANKPTECSLIAFSVNEDDAAVNGEARRLLKIAEDRSFLISVAGGQKERNSKEVTTKYQLNTMLSPRFDLPVARRGAISLRGAEVNAVFDYSQSQEFDALREAWQRKMSAPFFGKQYSREATSTEKPDLFT